MRNSTKKKKSLQRNGCILQPSSDPQLQSSLKSAEVYLFVPVCASDPIFPWRAEGEHRHCCWDQQHFCTSKQRVGRVSRKVAWAQLTDWAGKSHCLCDKCPFTGCKLFHISRLFCCVFLCTGRILHSVWLCGKLPLPNARSYLMSCCWDLGFLDVHLKCKIYLNRNLYQVKGFSRGEEKGIFSSCHLKLFYISHYKVKI